MGGVLVVVGGVVVFAVLALCGIAVVIGGARSNARL